MRTWIYLIVVPAITVGLYIALSGCATTSRAPDRAVAGVYHVAPGGNDAHPGTRERPFATLRRAGEVAQPGDRVLLRAGVYTETLAPPRSGLPGAPITFARYADEQVDMVAGTRISGWTPLGNGGYVADCPVDLGPGLNQVVADGALMIEARTPNIGDQHALVHVFELRRTFPSIAGEDSMRTAEPRADLRTEELVHYVGRHGGAWGTQTVRGTVDEQGGMDVQARTDKGYLGWWKGRGNGYVVGAREYWDHPREWYLDREAGKLYFLPPPGKDPNEMEVYIKDRPLAIDLGDRRHIVVDGINTRMGSVRMEGSAYCVIRNSALWYGGHHTFFENPYSYDDDLGAKSGVLMTGSNNVIERCHIAWNAGASVVIGGDGNRVLNSRIHDSGLLGSYYSGIYIFQAAKGQGGGHAIASNTLYHLGRGAIHVSSIGGWGDPGVYARPMRIHHNDISGAMLICDDGGAIYQFCTDGAGSEIHHNWIFSGRGEQIYFDNYSQGWRVHHNVIGGEVNVNFPNTDLHLFNNTLLKTRYHIPKYFWNKTNFLSHNIDTYYQAGEGWDGATANGVRPTQVNFVGQGEGGLKYRVQSIRAGVRTNIAPRVSTVRAEDLPAFSDRYFGAYAYEGVPWTAGSDWGDPVPDAPRKADAPLDVRASEYAYQWGLHDQALLVRTTQTMAWARYKDVDFSPGFSHVVFDVMLEQAMPDAVFELRLGSPEGERIASASVRYRAGERHQFFVEAATLADVEGRHDVYLTIQAEREVAIARFTLVGAGATPLFRHHPKELVEDRQKIEASAYSPGRQVLLMGDYGFKHPEVYLSGSFELRGCGPGRWLFFPKVDFGEGRDHLMVSVGSSPHDDPAPVVEMRSGSPDGPLLGTLAVERVTDGMWREQRMPLNNVSGIHDVFLVFPRWFGGGVNYVLF